MILTEKKPYDLLFPIECFRITVRVELRRTGCGGQILQPSPSMMLRYFIPLATLAALLLGCTGNAAVPPTHESSKTIRIPLEDQNLEIRTFVVDQKGRLLAATGGTQFVYKYVDGDYVISEVETSPSICVFDGDGNLEATWKLDVTPEALAVAPDGAIFAAGLGKIVKLSDTGKILKMLDSPHLKSLPPLPDLEKLAAEETEEQKKDKAQRIVDLTAEMGPLQQKLSESYAELLKAQKDNNQDKVIQIQTDVETLTIQYRTFHTQLTSLKADPKAFAVQQRNAAIQARSVKSIAVTEQDVFLCCPPSTGYASVVWRMNHDFEEEQIVVKGLSGCCGQMNIAAIDGKLVVPENGRMRVNVYDRDGKVLHQWGEDERDNETSGFGSCCNPMNLTFDAAGNVLTSEASVGAIKRFTLDGKFIESVAQSKIVPGCKHTPIGISPDGDTVYMLDVTQRQVIVMKK
ncbi:MAG: hypothetical protein FWC43_02865 [Planctomycetaceae bacterium]|nr:hypothetical protein [Planctomycetaceae bacterium]